MSKDSVGLTPVWIPKKEEKNIFSPLQPRPELAQTQDSPERLKSHKIQLGGSTLAEATSSFPVKTHMSKEMSAELLKSRDVSPRQAPCAGIKRFKTQTREEKLKHLPFSKVFSKAEDVDDTSSFSEDFSLKQSLAHPELRPLQIQDRSFQSSGTKELSVVESDGASNCPNSPHLKPKERLALFTVEQS